MNVAFLFNSDHPEIGGWYGKTVMDKILETQVIQDSKRHMRLSLGDVEFSSVRGREQEVYTPFSWDRRVVDRLEATYGKAVVYSWLFQNMSDEIAEDLHEELKNLPYYLGAMDLEFSNPFHLYCFRNRLPEYYRFYGNNCSLFYSMSEADGQDEGMKEVLEGFGFNASFEDTGARRTIFDNFDTIDHFKRILNFRQIFSEFDGWSDNETSQLVYHLEELHPYLFNILYAAARAYSRAEVMEELSQSYLSGRRFIEQLSNTLFPPQDEPYKAKDGLERKVGQDKHINRLAAYIETAAVDHHNAEEIIKKLGSEANRLYEVFCRGVHKPHSRDKEFLAERERAKQAFSDLGAWLIQLIEINPQTIRRPYAAYNEDIIDFLRDALKERTA